MRPFLTLATAAITVAVAIAAARAETSSWIGHGDATGGEVHKKSPARPGGAKALKVAPAERAKTEPGAKPAVALPIFHPKPTATAQEPNALPKIPPAVVAGENTSTVAKTPAADENAAYEAFDQGKYLTALELAVKAAAKDDPEAHTLVGRIYAEGDGTARNAALAAQWYARGVELGDAQAMFAYGMMLVEGVGVSKDRQAAAAMLEAAAVRRHPLANYNLALLFLTGSGKPENPYRGFLHMRFAAEAGVVVAQYDLGTLYATGTGVDANAFEAANWIGKAAAAGHAEAQLDFGVLLFQGRGVPPDQQRGARMFKSAAEQGLSVAQNRLARCYAHGAGVEKDVVKAATWHLLAKAGGVDDKSLDELVARLSKPDRAKADKAAEAWGHK
jgi:TPR repeat protein